MKGMPHFRQYPMGDVVNANLEPGEYVVRRNAVNALGVDNMELLNHADGAHGALNKLMVSASLVNHQSQDNTSVKTEANGFPIADSPVRQRVDATRQMQEGGPVSEGLKFAESYEYNPTKLESLLDKVPGIGGKRAYDRARDYYVKAHHNPDDMKKTDESMRQQSYVRGKHSRHQSESSDRGLRDVWQSRDLVHNPENPREFSYRNIVEDMDKGMIDQFISGSDVGHVVEEDDYVKHAIDPSNIAKFDKGKDLLGFIPMGYSGSVKQNPGIDPYIDVENLAKQVGEVDAEKINLQQGGPVRGYQEGDLVEDSMRWLKDPTQERVYHGMAPGEKEFSRSTKLMPYDQQGQLRARSERLTGDYGGVSEAYEAVKAGKAPEGYNLQISEEDMYPSFKGELITGSEADSLWDASGFQGGGPVYGYKNGGQVKSERQAAQDSLMHTDEYDDVRAEDAKQLQIMAMLDSLNQGGGEKLRTPEGGGGRSDDSSGYSPSFDERFNMWEQTGQGVESSRARQLRMAKVPADNYSGEDVVKDMDSLKHYFRSFGRLKTPLQERNEFLYNRLGVDPENPPMQLQGLKGRALLQRYGNEVQ